MHHAAPVARWSHLADRLPCRLEDLSGPGDGSVQLPLNLAWSGLTSFDLCDERLLFGLYRIVITNGLRDDLIAYLNADLLIRHWPKLRVALGKQVRICWELRFPQLRAAALAGESPVVQPGDAEESGRRPRL
ncbi:hypothetical protein ABZX34_02310 [Streptomyces sp. NPDC004362]|uniref:hypothetical protein n=1 Tax=Streptomyces sp. NPDC004362 TaxID=3154456 RepID=UPI00339FAF97